MSCICRKDAICRSCPFARGTDAASGGGNVEPAVLETMPGFRGRLEWYLKNRPDLAGLISRWYEPGSANGISFHWTRGHRMKCLLRRMLDPNEFLSPPTVFAR